MQQFLRLFSFYSLLIASQVDANFDDGPYVFYGEQQLKVLSVCAGVRKETNVKVSQFPTQLSSPCHTNDAITVYAPAQLASQQQDEHKTTVVISDIHGQLLFAKKLLRAHTVIDQYDKWQLGSRRLVVLGDTADRGEQVTESYWFLYQLQQQAASVGGEVHVVLGNHEKMLLSGQTKYLHTKYHNTQIVLNQSQADLYGPSSVLGHWLRQQPSVLILGDDVYAHGGISAALVHVQLSLAQINQRISNSLAMPKEQLQQDPLLHLLHGENGPLWYRGYFREPHITPTEFDSVLRNFRARRIVVGHTTQEQIQTTLSQRVIVVDTGIKGGNYGELLWLDQDRCWRGLPNGEKIDLPCELPPSKDKE